MIVRELSGKDFDALLGHRTPRRVSLLPGVCIACRKQVWWDGFRWIDQTRPKHRAHHCGMIG